MIEGNCMRRHIEIKDSDNIQNKNDIIEFLKNCVKFIYLFKEIKNGKQKNFN